MNLINNPDNDMDDRPEPFATVLDLLEEHTEADVLSALSDAAQFDSENQELDSLDRLKAERLHLELEQLLERMDQFEQSHRRFGRKSQSNER